MWSARSGILRPRRGIPPRTNDIDIDEQRKTIHGPAEGKNPVLDKHRGTPRWVSRDR